MLCDAPLADTERGEDFEEWCDFSSSQAINGNGKDTDLDDGKTTASSSLDRLSVESFKFSAESLEALVTSFDNVVAKCLRTSISLDGIVPPPRIRHLDDLVEEECGNSYFSAFLTPNYLERLANVKWSECRTRALFVDSMFRSRKEILSSPKQRLKKRKNRLRSSSQEQAEQEESDESQSETSETPSLATGETPVDGDLHALMVSSVAEADYNEPQPIMSADDVINEIDEMMRAQEEAGEVEVGCDSFFPAHVTGSSNEIALIDDAVPTIDSGYDVSMTSSAFSVLPPGSSGSDDANFNSHLADKLKPLPLNSADMPCCSAMSSDGKFVAQSPQHSDEDVVQLFLAETLEEMSLSDLEKHAECLEVAIRKYSDVLVEELASRDEQIDLKETRDNFVGLVMSVQRRVRDVTSTNPSLAVQSASNNALNCSAQNLPADKKRNSPFVTTVIPFNPDAGPLSLDELRVLAKILQAMLDDSPAVPSLLTEYILTVLCAKENPRI